MHTISHFFQENTKPNLVFRLLLGTTLRLLKLMNSGEMSSNCRLFFIFVQSFSTKIFKAVFPQLLCNTSNRRSVEYVENAPNKYYCHRPSARKYETGASDENGDASLHPFGCLSTSFWTPVKKRWTPGSLYAATRADLCSSPANEASVP